MPIAIAFMFVHQVCFAFHFSKQAESYYKDLFISSNDDVNAHLQKIYEDPQIGVS